MNALTRLLRTTDPDRRLNVLGVATHERYEQGLSKAGHAFFALQGHGLKAWDPTYAPVPPGYTLLPPGLLPRDVGFDLVLCQSRAAHFKMLATLASRHRIPLVCLEHVLPNPHWDEATRKAMTAMRGDVNVFIGEYSRDAWGFGPDAAVIEHGVDTSLFQPRGPRSSTCLAVVNDWINRDAECGYGFWREATEGLPTRVLGKTPGLSEPARDLDHLADAYASSLLFLNTALRSPIPTVVLEAMSSGCCVVSTRNPMLESIVVDGVNGFLVDTPSEMHARASELLADPERAAAIGLRARGTILDRFGLDRFAAEWRTVLRAAANITLEG